jgi:hypothetical protein
MTVIAHVNTPEGFVVGADGRGVALDGTVLDDCVTKLFCLCGQRVTLACGWTGTTRFRSNKKQQEFDLSNETKRIGWSLAMENLGPQYVERLAGHLNQFIDDVVVDFDDLFGTHPAVALFIGYVNDEPKYWEFQIGGLPVELPPRHEEYKTLSGSRELLSGMIQARCLPPAETIRESEEGIQRYLDCCIQNNHLPDLSGCGGHVHIAAVTRHGFAWRVPPKELGHLIEGQ